MGSTVVRMGKKRKRKSNYGLWIIVLLLFVLAVGYLQARAVFSPVDQAGAEEQVNVVVPKNSSTAYIAGQLESEGLVHSALAFRLYARYHHIDGQFKPGTYQLNPAMTLDEINGQLIKGPDETIKITVPEGFTVAQVAGMLEQNGITGKDDFLRLTDSEWNYPYLKDIAAENNRLEGYLYPDTYHVSPVTSPEKLVQMMLDRFNTVIEEQNYIKQAADRDLTLHQAVIIASMVEREARVAGDRARIAGVIFNRLAIGMPLQLDATIQYVLETPKEVLLYKDLEVDSPYNTYKYPGLPPGPIACPGWPSLQAVIEPEEHDFLYYVAKPDGSHAFSRTLQEHNNNINKYQGQN